MSASRFNTGLICKHPDHDNPKMVCGYPIPCPYHTAIIDPFASPVPTLTIPVTADAALRMTARQRLAQIGMAVAPKPKATRKPNRKPKEKIT